MKRRPGGYTFTFPYCHTTFQVGGYIPGHIGCGKCGKTFNLR